MHTDISAIAVIGHKNSGKTTVVEWLIRELVKNQFRVSSAKHIGTHGVSLDVEGRDSQRHSDAGANPVLMVSDKETIMKMTGLFQNRSLDLLTEHSTKNNVDLLIFEGFSSIILKEKWVGKIICLRNTEEHQKYNMKVKGKVLAFCSFKMLGEPILSLKKDLPLILKEVKRFIERNRKVSKILDQLPHLDCRKCGKETCKELAEAIFDRKANLEACLPLKVKPKLGAKLTINGSEIPIQPFVSEVIRRTVLGMISTLKGVELEGDKRIHIIVS